MPETPYFKRILEHSSNYADINKKRSEWDLNPRARKRTTAFRVRLVMTTSITLPLCSAAVFPRLFPVKKDFGKN